MGTRGLFGFVVDGEVKVTYNHADSYPSGLGSDVLDWLKRADLDDAAARARQLELVTDAVPPTPAQVERLRQFHDPRVSTGSTTEWYSLLRHTQGDPAAVLAAGVMLDGVAFAADSLFCEWAYVVDFDRQKLEVYRGFQTAPHADGRFASDTPDRRGYYPIRLVAEFSFDDLPPDEEFVAQLQAVVG